MHKAFNPPGMAEPAGMYSHGVEVPPNARWLYIAGQVGMKPDGTTAAGIEEQTEWAWRNLVTVLETAGMGVNNLVKINVYLARQGDFESYARVRTRFLGEARPASTLIYVAGLARPEWLVEVEGIAVAS